MAETLGFIDPTAGGDVARIPLARRPMDLAGATVGLLDNTKEQGDVILHTLGSVLQERYGVARVVLQRKEHYSKPAAPALIEAMAQEVTVAIAAVGG
ncbi:MAG: hypothetical protein FJZ47_04770 [Candidatus Tectomicrobia bacterium]|uniref:UGSC-like domain-containing protein n=1 Tax=Tectimicrobiota bacterium TaxID=2528274 RepID=A0A937W0J8_UNCTE|nr:hypothetical protein [Candidatus Tectomicrobia bacterium]